VIEPDPACRAELAGWLEHDWRIPAVAAAAPTEGRAKLHETPPDLLVLCVDGDEALDLVRGACRLQPAPLVFATGRRPAAERAFALGAAGVCGLLTRPFDRAEFSARLRRSLERPPDLVPFVQASVAHRGMTGLVQLVRHVMVTQAMAIAGDNRSEAGRLLRVTRQAIQQAIRANGLRAEPAAAQRPPCEVELGLRRVV
jgi:DNA-binding response OmpR family regulator